MTTKQIATYVTDRLIAEMDNGVIPWRKPWTGLTGQMGGCVSHDSGKPYSFTNQILIGEPGEYVTYKKVIAEGGRVKKGAKSHMVIFWTTHTVTDIDPVTKEEVKKTFPILKQYNVFNVKDCEGIATKYFVDPTKVKKPTIKQAFRKAENIIKRYFRLNPSIKLLNTEVSDEAFYRPSTDEIVVPTMGQYAETAEYYSTLFHEMAHSTGHESRLNRLDKKAAFGTENYGREELVAEISAAMLVNIAGCETEKSFKNSASYIKNWSKAIKRDPMMFIVASGKADKAVEYILRTKRA